MTMTSKLLESIAQTGLVTTSTVLAARCAECGTEICLDIARPAVGATVRALGMGALRYLLDTRYSLKGAIADATGEIQGSSPSLRMLDELTFCMRCRRYVCDSCWMNADSSCIRCLAATLGADNSSTHDEIAPSAGTRTMRLTGLPSVADRPIALPASTDSTPDPVRSSSCSAVDSSPSGLPVPAFLPAETSRAEIVNLATFPQGSVAVAISPVDASSQPGNELMPVQGRAQKSDKESDLTGVESVDLKRRGGLHHIGVVADLPIAVESSEPRRPRPTRRRQGLYSGVESSLTQAAMVSPASARNTVAVCGYAADSVVKGALMVSEGRPSDLIAESSRIVITDATLMALEDGRLVRSEQIEVDHDELVAIAVAGSNANLGRRQRTVPRRIVIRSGPYRILGTLHARPGVDTLAFAHRRRAGLPLTDARVRFELNGTVYDEHVQVLVVNVDRADSLVDADRHPWDASLTFGSSTAS